MSVMEEVCPAGDANVKKFREDSPSLAVLRVDTRAAQFFSSSAGLPGSGSQSRLTRGFGTRAQRVFAGLVFVVPFAQLLFQFLGDQVNRRVEIALAILGEQIGTGDGKADRTGELPFGSRRWSCSSVARAVVT